MGKTISKSIRLSDDMYQYIYNYRGNGFNEKFENIIQDARDAEPDRLYRLKLLDKELREKQQMLRKIQEFLRVYSFIRDRADTLNRDLSNLIEIIQEVTEE